MRAIKAVKKFLFLFSLFSIFCFPAHAALIVDTGLHPSGTTSGGYEVSEYNFLAGEFTIDQGYTLTDIKGWISGITGSQLTVAIYADDNPGNLYVPAGEVPGTELYQQIFTSGTVLDWYGPENLSWSLDPGSYWVSFEVRDENGDDFFGGMPNWQTVPNPLDNYAYWYFLNSAVDYWYYQDTINFGVRIEANAVPIPGTAILFSSCILGLVSIRRKFSKR